MKWLQQLHQLCQENVPCVLVTVAGTRGSAPREVGAKMIVTPTATIGTIGGGQLEYLCTQSACEWLQPEQSEGRSKRVRFPLGANCGQCCGGVVEILFEHISQAQHAWVEQLAKLANNNTPALMLTSCQSRATADKLILTATGQYSYAPDARFSHLDTDTLLTQLHPRTHAHAEILRDHMRSPLPVLIEPVMRPDFHIAVFGAGHVGSACVKVLSMLEAQIDLVDGRSMFTQDSYPANVRALHANDPVAVIATIPPDAFYLVMTHDHAQDLVLCAQILQRKDIAYCGLIGSRSKRRRFEKRFTALGLSLNQISRLTCPIGIGQIHGKKPQEIAIAVSAQLLSLREAQLARLDETDHAHSNIVRYQTR